MFSWLWEISKANIPLGEPFLNGTNCNFIASLKIPSDHRPIHPQRQVGTALHDSVAHLGRRPETLTLGRRSFVGGISGSFRFDFILGGFQVFHGDILGFDVSLSTGAVHRSSTFEEHMDSSAAYEIIVSPIKVRKLANGPFFFTWIMDIRCRRPCPEELLGNFD